MAAFKKGWVNLTNNRGQLEMENRILNKAGVEALEKFTKGRLILPYPPLSTPSILATEKYLQ
jgi:hypothetical protein